MSIKENTDYLYLVWKEPNTRRQYVVGKLSKNSIYEFRYDCEVSNAITNGFKPLIAFEDLDTVYESSIMFPAFSCRLPDRKRNGIDKILTKYELNEYDEYELLKRSGAKLPIDNLEFIDPIIYPNDKDIKRLFYIAGARHYVGCNGSDCIKSINIKSGDKLELVAEPDNMYDGKAIKLLDQNKNHIGYLPRYYCETVLEYLNKANSYSCTISEVQKNNNCNECIRAELVLYK